MVPFEAGAGAGVIGLLRAVGAAERAAI
jgi:hypothetical protein